jgi:uncharacterized protein YdhG (YjbR/CyaY superfamily)
MNKNNKQHSNMGEYIAGFPQDVQAVLGKLRRVIQESAPDAKEAISYGMPTFKLNGNLVHFAAHKNHIGFYPTPSAIVAFKEELSPYETSKGAIQFPLDKAIPLKLVEKMVKFRVNEEMNNIRNKKDTKPHIEHHKDGSIMAKGNTINGSLEGYWEWFRKDGSKMRSGYFKNGKQVGEWITFSKTGVKVKITNFK